MAERSVLIKLGSKVGPGGERGFKRMRKGISGLGSMAAKALNFGKYVALGGAAVATAFLVKGVADARTFGKAMAEVSTLVDTSTINMKALSQEVLDLSRATGKGPEDLAKALYDAVSAGVDAAEAMDFLAVSSKLAVGGFADMKDVVNLGTNVLNAFGMSAKEMGRVSDIAFETVKQGKTTITELAQSMGTVLPFAAQLEVSLEDIFAATATLTKGGIDTANAVTFLKGVMTSVLKPTNDATKAAKRLGIDFTAAALKAKGFRNFLAEVGAATKGSSVELAKLFPNVRGLTAVLGLAGKQSEEFTRIQQALKASVGATDVAFAKAASSSGVQFDKALNELKIIGIELGTEVLPSVVKILAALTPHIESAAKWTAALAEGFAAVLEGGTGLKRFFAEAVRLGSFGGLGGLFLPKSLSQFAATPEERAARDRREMAGTRQQEFLDRLDRTGTINVKDAAAIDATMRRQGDELGAKIVNGTQRAVDQLKHGIEAKLREQNQRQITLAPV